MTHNIRKLISLAPKTQRIAQRRVYKLARRAAGTGRATRTIGRVRNVHPLASSTPAYQFHDESELCLLIDPDFDEMGLDEVIGAAATMSRSIMIEEDLFSEIY